MMIKKIKHILFLLLASISTFFIIGCAPTDNKDSFYNNRNYFVDNKIQDSKDLKKFTSLEITKDQLSKIPSLNEFYHSPILVGGYGEPRKFYSETRASKIKSINYHAGMDVLLKDNTKILAPAKGQIFAGWWYAPVKETIARGVGGEVGLRVKIKDLLIDPVLKEYVYIRSYSVSQNNKNTKTISRVPKILFSQYQKYQKPDLSKLKTLFKDFVKENDYYNWLNLNFSPESKKKILDLSQYIYFYFIHLSKKSMNLIDKNAVATKMEYYNNNMYYQNLTHYSPDNMKEVKAKEPIGYVGNILENGGWVPHVHMESYAFMSPSKSLKSGGNRITRTFITSKYKSILPGQEAVKYFWKKRGYMKAKAVGTDLVYMRNNKIFTQWETNGLSYKQYQGLKRAQIDVNEIFNLHNKSTPVVKSLTSH